MKTTGTIEALPLKETMKAGLKDHTANETTGGTAIVNAIIVAGTTIDHDIAMMNGGDVRGVNDFIELLCLLADFDVFH